jgi:beta-ribofuranosylaminobenzene 5'-phosphate synthase
MDSDGYRHNGGVGFCVSEPQAMVRVSAASEFSLQDVRRWPLQATEQSRLANIAQNFAKAPVLIKISGDMPSHYGFGSATGIRLATIEAIAILTGDHVDRLALVRASGRGATSGIGVTTYFDGGLVFDLGIKNAGLPLLPSSALEGARPLPLVVTQLEMPAWKIGMCIPSGIPPQTEAQEVAFFKRSCPTSAADTKEALYQVIYGAIASVKERDFAGFCAAIKAIQRCTWKRLERGLYGKPLLSIENEIYRAGASAVGMSSLGPGLFFLADEVDVVTHSLKAALPQHVWIAAAFYNSGRNLISQ